MIVSKIDAVMSLVNMPRKRRASTPGIDVHREPARVFFGEVTP